jgi:uncharacterized protein YukE
MAMTQEEATAALTATNETLVKVSNETDSLLKEIDRLNKALEEAQAAGTVTPELEAAVKAVNDRANAIDQLVADVPQPESAKRK